MISPPKRKPQANAKKAAPPEAPGSDKSPPGLVKPPGSKTSPLPKTPPGSSPRPEGRPTKYVPDYCAQVVEHMKQGLSFESFAGRIGVDRDTIYTWRHAHPEFSDAVSRGFAGCQLFWEQVGRDGTMGMLRRVTEETPQVDKQGKPVIGPDGKPVIKKRYAPAQFSSQGWRFNMENRFRWRTRIETVDTPAPAGEAQGTPYASLSEAEVDRRLAAEVADLQPSIPKKAKG